MRVRTPAPPRRGAWSLLRCCAAGGLALAAAALVASPASAAIDDAGWVTHLLRRSALGDDEAHHSRRSQARRDHRHARTHRHGRQARHAGAHKGKGASAPPPVLHARLETVETAGVPPMPRADKGAARARRGAPLGTVLASLGREIMQFVPHAPPAVSGAPILWRASSDCLAFPLRGVLVDLAASFGPLKVNSTCRSRSHNAKVGGAKRSFHLTGNAVDFRIAGSARPVLAFLRARSDVGGLKHYGGGVFHIDTGARRTW
jgi:hypothetical protein